jgi:RTX calcium-binding nonapeptide repeat (4 copies)
MGLSRPRRLALLLSLGLLTVLAFALPASASAARVLYADGHEIDESRLATFGGHTLVAPGPAGFDACSDSEWATQLARTDFDVLVVGENAPGCVGSLSPGTLTNIANYVSGGKPIIVSGAHGSQDDFLNAVFGFSTTETDSDSSESLFGSIQPAATGTPFEGGPPTLTTPSATNLLGGTPGTTIYSGPEGVYVFTVPFGAGKVTYLAWDLCGEPENCGNTPSVEDDWYRVLDRAMTMPTPTAAPKDMCMGREATITGTAGNDNLTGTPGADVIVGLGGNDTVNGLGGNDVVCGRTGRDKLKGGAGSDRIQGNKAPDRLNGGGGGDQCRGGKGKDKASACETTRALSAV